MRFKKKNENKKILSLFIKIFNNKIKYSNIKNSNNLFII